MEPTGTLRAGISTLDPYANAWLGFQIAAPLYIGIRQTAEVSDLRDDATRLYPGIDLKLRLLQEGRIHPEISVGLQAATGHKRMAGEYVVFSKRYNAFDFTGGIGWGRIGSAEHISNPLKILGNHFGDTRARDGEMPTEPNDWFTGNEIGFFGGVEYFTPIKGLSMKFDYNAERYKAERAATNFEAPAPWSAGLNYRPADWIDLGLATQGLDKVMARVSLKTFMPDWRSNQKPDPDAEKLRNFRTGLGLPARMELAGQSEGVLLQETTAHINSAQTHLLLSPHGTTPYQLGRAAIHMANHAGPEIEEFVVTPTIAGLRGPSVRLMRRDFEQALIRHQGSPEEIWRNAEFDTRSKPLLDRHNRFVEIFSAEEHIGLILDNQLSLAEEDNGTLYRTALLAKIRAPRMRGFLDAGLGLRLNLKHNLEKIRDIRPRALLPVRSNVDDFADRTITLDESYVAFTHSLRPDLHLALIGGYLEEMYAGAGGEILYRLFGSRWAVGAESWLALKRDPETTLNMMLNGDHLLTGHMNAYYDVPEIDVTLKARVGRYLAEDIGGTLGLQKIFRNGAALEGFVTVTDFADFDLFGGTTHAYNGVRLSMPLGGYKYMPKEASIRFKAEPFGRDTGQSLETPLALYELTEPFSFSHVMQNWGDIVE